MSNSKEKLNNISSDAIQSRIMSIDFSINLMLKFEHILHFWRNSFDKRAQKNKWFVFRNRSRSRTALRRFGNWFVHNFVVAFGLKANSESNDLSILLIHFDDYNKQFFLFLSLFRFLVNTNTILTTHSILHWTKVNRIFSYQSYWPIILANVMTLSPISIIQLIFIGFFTQTTTRSQCKWVNTVWLLRAYVTNCRPLDRTLKESS